MAEKTAMAGYYDPYDLWATQLGVTVRKWFYQGRLTGKLGAGALALGDWLLPIRTRDLLGVPAKVHPITAAHLVLQDAENGVGADRSALELLEGLAAWRGSSGRWAWGLGFPWMSKNGLYPADTPFITHTPYVMEALLLLAETEALADEAMAMFHGTWSFLESLLPMYQGPDQLALSYAPVLEPRIVVNANAYASFAYALHARYGRAGIRDSAAHKARNLASWVVAQQERSGAWPYYADEQPGNFVDCFHSCFVVKNLNKVARLLPELGESLMEPVLMGWRFLQERFYDRGPELCRRFILRDIKDPYVWDLYDQSEYLGLLVDFGQLAEALRLRHKVESRFRRGESWYCRIDKLGMLWGENFLRWGIAPFWHHSARLDRAMSATGGN